MQRRTRAEWKRLMDEHDAGDLSLAEFSERKGLKKESFRWWRKVFRREERRREEALEAIHANHAAGQPLTQRLVDLLALGPGTAHDLAPHLKSKVSDVERELRELGELGVVFEESRKGSAPRWHLG